MSNKFRVFLIVTLVLVSPCSLYANNSLLGNWLGKAKSGDEETGFILHIENHQGQYQVSVSLPNIGVSKWPATDIEISNSSVSVNLPSDSGKQKIKLSLVGNKLNGSWKDNPSSKPSTLILNRNNGGNGFSEHRLSIQGKAGNIGVSYVLPPNTSLTDNPKSFPAVILTHGSGAVSRDINRFTAESFAKLGIAAIFYDKRGIGETDGDFDDITFEQLADDAISVAEHFNKQSAVRSVGFWGHSQGGWIAPLAASRWQPSTFTIMSAGPTVTPAREAEWTYLYPLLKRNDIASIEPVLSKLVSSWHDGLREDNFDKYRYLVDKYENQEWFESSGIDSLRTYFLGSFYESYKLYMDYDPDAVLTQLKKPLMAIFSSDDESINSAESIEILQQFQEQGKHIQIVEYTGYSHSMRKLPKDGKVLRFPNFPEDYFLKQSQFIKQSTMTKLTKSE